MAPGYKPLTGAGGLQGAPNLPAEIFKPPQFQSIEDYDRAQAVLLAQELANQQNEIALQERQRIANEQATIRESIKNQYAGQEEFDPRIGLETAQRIAMQNGDYVTALNIEKTIKERSGTQPLTPSEREFFAPLVGGQLPENATLQQLQVWGALDRGNAWQDLNNDPNRVAKRGWDRILAEQRATGTQVRPLTSGQEDELTGLSEIGDLTNNILDRYLPSISENRGERWLAAKVNPNSAIARMDNELTQLVFALAAARNGKRISDADFEYMAPLVKPNDLDTVATVEDKIRRVVEFAELRQINLLGVLGKSGRNVSKFGPPEQEGIMIPRANKGSGSPYVPPGSTMLGVDPGTGLAIIRKQ